MATTNVKRLVLIASGGFAVVAVALVTVFALESARIATRVPRSLPAAGSITKRAPWPQLQEGQTIDLEVPPELEEIDEMIAERRRHLIPASVVGSWSLFQRATGDSYSKIEIPETSLIDNKTYWEKYDAYVTDAMDRQLQKLPEGVAAEFGETLQLLKTRLAKRDRSLRPEQEDLERLATATEPLPILADTIFRRDEYAPEALVDRCRESLFALLESDTHGYVVFVGAQELLVGLRDNRIPFTETDYGLLFRAFQRLCEATSEDAETSDSSFPIFMCNFFALQTFNDFDESAQDWFVRTTGEFIAENPDVDSYAFFCLAGMRHRNIGWKARGSGWASEVPDEAWPVFGSETQMAADYLQAAYSLHEDIPYAPCQLIDLAKTSDVGGSPKQWLNRTLAIQRDYFKAYSNYSYTLSPRWGGSNDLQVEFANACIEMNDFGPGGISWEAVEALKTIRRSTSVVDQELDEIRGYTETLCSFADAVIAAYEADVRDDCDFPGMRNLITWLSQAGEYERLQHVLSFGQPSYVWTYEGWVRGLGAAYGGPLEDDVRELFLDLYAPERPVMTPERLVAWRSQIEQVREETEDEHISRFLDLCEANISAGEEYFNQEWVNFSVHNDELAGRVSIGADRISYDEQDCLVLEGRQNGYYTKVAVIPRLPGPMLIDCNFQPLRKDNSPYMENFGIVVGQGPSSHAVTSPQRAVYVNNIWNAMGYRTLPLGEDGPHLPGDIPVASWTGYRMGMLVLPSETRAYWHMKEIHREAIAFDDPFVPISIRPLLNYAAERIFRVKYIAIHYCPDGELPEEYDPANSQMHEKAAKRAAGEPTVTAE